MYFMCAEVNGSFSMSSQNPKSFFIPSTTYFNSSTQMCESASQSQNSTTALSDPAFHSNFLGPSTDLVNNSQSDGQLSVSNSCATLPQDYGLQNNLSNYTSSLVNTLNNSAQTSSLNFATSNQFYTVGGKLQDSYNQVHRMDFSTSTLDDMNAQACSFDAALQTYNTSTPQLNGDSQPGGMYGPVDSTYNSVPVNHTVDRVQSTYLLNSGGYQDGSSAGQFPSQYCVVPDGQYNDVSKPNPLHQNTADYQKPFQQFFNSTGGVSLPDSDSMGDEQLTVGVGMVNTSVDVGIQCEVGPETLQALLDEEEEEGEGEDLEEGDEEREEGFDVEDTNDQSQPKEGVFLCTYV